MTDWQARDMPLCHCLDCGKEFDAVSGEGSPRPGNVTICIDCGHIMAFADDMSVRALTDEEMIAVAGNEKLIRYQEALQSVKRMKSHGAEKAD